MLVRMNGLKQVSEVKIEPDAAGSGDLEMLQDLVVAAFNEAARKVDEAMAGQIGGPHRRNADPGTDVARRYLPGLFRCGFPPVPGLPVAIRSKCVTTPAPSRN